MHSLLFLFKKYVLTLIFSHNYKDFLLIKFVFFF